MPVLTAPSVLNYTAQAKRREIPDARATGLYLVIQPKPSGAKSWALRFRKPDGKPAKLVLGPVDFAGRETKDDPVIGASLTLGQARELAAQIDRKRKRGIDVIAEYKASKLRQRADAQERAANTFATCVREFFADYRTERWHTRPRRWRGDAALLGLRYPPGCDPKTTEPEIIKGGLYDTWRDKAVATIDGHTVHVAVNAALKHSPGRARKLHAALSVLFGWLLQQRRVAGNPAHGVWRPKPPPERERVLSDAEIKAFWRAAEDAEEVTVPFGALFKLMLLTGARLREVAGMRRAEIVDGVWTVPAERSKNHRAFSLVLPPLALEIIKALPVIESEAGLLFTTNGKRPVSGFSSAKRQLDATMAKHAGKAVPAWRLHDLRRTCATGLASLGVTLPVIEKILNHRSGSFGGIVSVYQKHEYADEKRQALARWAKHLVGLVAAPSGKVVRMRKAR